ncbi:ComEA family DNA-binding protein [Paenibacillus allorhizosphaerae]|uniref:Helix-hairpin-helix DNA-binding motif class 1 domain-containing protein n=1 Tax=Paenibacillus allorhizosphaerae TaxID=2849866 RepID=A0ABM8VFF3_9BACL|nr:helix-hairpin-helix domain-containing protein [Paenibacillus allorhizosphaerae]CAG7634824.1 hypothetical protein PAECIP111802_02070 [Paenibacillus allorhizosphaerae]
MSKGLMNFAVFLAFGLICCVLLWRPWAPNEASMGFKSADEEMRALLQQQTEERQAGAKASGSGKEAAAKAAPAPTANAKEAQPKNEPAKPADAKGTPENAPTGPPAEPEDKQTPLSEIKGTSQAGKINLNTATAEQLDELPGIGPSRAQAIIAIRQKLGGKFTSVEQLLEVKGIGEKMLSKIAPLVTLGP